MIAAIWTIVTICIAIAGFMCWDEWLEFTRVDFPDEDPRAVLTVVALLWPAVLLFWLAHTLAELAFRALDWIQEDSNAQ